MPFVASLAALLLQQPLLAAPMEGGVADRTLHDALLSRFHDSFPEDSAAPSPNAPRCLTPLVAELKANWGLFSPAERRRMSAILTPWKEDLLDEPGRRSDFVSPPGFSCLGQQGDYQLLSDRFSVEWDDTSLDDEAADFFDALEFSWAMEIDAQGWTAPTGTDRYPVLAFVYKQDSYGGAYTSVEYCRGVGYVPYIVAYSGSFLAGSWYEVMAAHEFNHASQFSTSFAPEAWLWEATATYWEENVYPSSNDWSNYIRGYTSNPWIGMNAYSDRNEDIFYHMYGMAIMGFLLDDHFGGMELIRDIWLDAASSRAGQYELTLPEMLEDRGYDWTEVLHRFMASVTVMDFREHAWFPRITVEDTISALPATGAPSRDSHRPQSLGQNLFRFDGALGDSGKDLLVAFDGDDGPEWHAILVSVWGSEVVEIVPIEVDANGAGEGRIAFQGDDVYLVVTPWDSTASGYNYNWARADDWSYTWTADLTDAGPDDTGGDDTGGNDTSTGPDDDTGDGDPDEDLDGEAGLLKPGGACGCSTRGTPALLWGLLPGLLLLARRRHDA